MRKDRPPPKINVKTCMHGVVHICSLITHILFTQQWEWKKSSVFDLILYLLTFLSLFLALHFSWIAITFNMYYLCMLYSFYMQFAWHLHIQCMYEMPVMLMLTYWCTCKVERWIHFTGKIKCEEKENNMEMHYFVFSVHGEGNWKKKNFGIEAAGRRNWKAALLST